MSASTYKHWAILVEPSSSVDHDNSYPDAIFYHGSYFELIPGKTQVQTKWNRDTVFCIRAAQYIGVTTMSDRELEDIWIRLLDCWWDEYRPTSTNCQTFSIVLSWIICTKKARPLLAELLREVLYHLRHSAKKGILGGHLGAIMGLNLVPVVGAITLAVSLTVHYMQAIGAEEGDKFIRDLKTKFPVLEDLVDLSEGSD